MQKTLSLLKQVQLWKEKEQTRAVRFSIGRAKLRRMATGKKDDRDAELEAAIEAPANGRTMKPRIHLLALGGTIAMQPGERGMKVRLGADDLARMAPGLDAIADVQAETVSRIG